MTVLRVDWDQEAAKAQDVACIVSTGDDFRVVADIQLVGTAAAPGQARSMDTEPLLRSGGYVSEADCLTRFEDSQTV